MPLYFKKTPGLYISGGDWADPANWYDETGTPVNRVPTSSDTVYVTGDVTGSGVAGAVVVGTEAEIGGPIISQCQALGAAQKCCCCAFGWGIMICNSNAVTDDDFDVILNGETIGQHEAREYSVKGEFWRTDSSITKDALCVAGAGGVGDVELCGPTNDACQDVTYEWPEITCVPCATSSDMSDETVDVTLFKQGTNTIEMINTNANFCEKVPPGTPEDEPPQPCGNYGRIWVFEFCKKSDGTVELSKILVTGAYQGDSGENGGPYTFSISSKRNDECTCKPIVYECLPNAGCTETRNPSGTCFVSSAECEAACLQRYTCKSSTGCEQSETYSLEAENSFPTESACTDVCLNRFSCDTYAGCTSTGYATTGNTQTECENTCSAQSYNCGYGYGFGGGGCEPVYNATTGQFNSLAACQAVCLARASCDVNYGCQYIGFGTSGILYANCSTDCVPQSYNCFVGDYYTSGGCKPLYNDTGGEFSTQGACQANCLERATCDTYSGCQYIGFGTSGMLYANCATECVVQSYNCDSNYGCVGLRNSTSGAFPTLTACQAANCVYNYTCYDYGWGTYCDATGYQINGQSYSVCAANCPPPAMTMPIKLQGGATNDETITAYAQFLKTASQPPQWTNAAQQKRQQNTFVTYVSPSPSRPSATVPLDEQDPIGPGTFLSKTLENIGIKSSPTCSCKARARLMNDKGNDWCAANVPTLVGWLREEAEKRKLPFIDIAGTLLIKRAISLSRAAKKKQVKNESKA